MNFNGKMTSKGQILNVSEFYGRKWINLKLVREYKESPKIVRKPEHGFEPTWSELRAEAMEKGVFKVGMKKDDIKKALNDLRK